MKNLDCNATSVAVVSAEVTSQDSDLILFLLACRVAWLHEQDRAALDQLWIAQQAEDPDTRLVAQWLLHGIEKPLPPPA